MNFFKFKKVKKKDELFEDDIFFFKIKSVKKIKEFFEK